jgi:glycosyltransferase involved in cell wall biosynthesis
MRICLLSKMYPPVSGGSAMYAYEIANALGKRGHDVDVYTQSKSDDKSSLSVHDNVSVYSLTKARRYLVTFETIYYSIRARSQVDLDDYDIIHGTLMPASTITLSDRLTFDTPIVLTSHSFALSEVFAHSPEKPADYLLKYAFHPMNVVMDNIAARPADAVIAISSEMNDQLVTQYGLPSQKVTTVSHGVDTDRYRPHDGTHPAVSGDCLSLLFVGRLISRKGADLAIEALAEADSTDIELLIAGTGRLGSKLEQLAADLGVSDRVNFLGYVPDEDLPLLYSSADVTLFTSNYEGFGLVLLESLASGTPVIGSAVGGIPDLIEDGVSGYIVPRDPLSFADRIETLHTDREQLATLSETARDIAGQQTWDHVASDVEEVYERVLTEP